MSVATLTASGTLSAQSAVIGMQRRGLSASGALTSASVSTAAGSLTAASLSSAGAVSVDSAVVDSNGLRSSGPGDHGRIARSSGRDISAAGERSTAGRMRC